MPTYRRSLDQLEVREPCHVPWDAMHDASASRRFCDSCAKHVHDLSALSRDEAERLLRLPGEAACVRFARDATGRVLTREDFAGPAPQTRRQLLRRLGGLAAAIGVGWAFQLGCDRPTHEAGPDFATGKVAEPLPTTGPTPVPTTTPTVGEIRGDPTLYRTMGIVAPPTPAPSTRPTRRRAGT